MPLETIHFILTGGTIDSYWDGIADTAVPLKHSVIPEFIRSLKLYSPTEFTEVCMKDSRQLNEDDRQNILNAVERSNFAKIADDGKVRKREDGKVLKPVGWTPPELEPFTRGPND